MVSFSYPVGEETDEVFGGSWSFNDAAMKPFRTVMILPHDKVLTVMDKLQLAVHVKSCS